MCVPARATRPLADASAPKYTAILARYHFVVSGFFYNKNNKQKTISQVNSNLPVTIGVNGHAAVAGGHVGIFCSSVFFAP